MELISMCCLFCTSIRGPNPAVRGPQLCRREPFYSNRCYDTGRQRHNLRRTGWSIAQPGSPCEEDPASPVLFALIKPLNKSLQRFLSDQYSSRSGLISCRIVVAISSIDLVVVDSQRMPDRRIIASASATSIRQFSSEA